MSISDSLRWATGLAVVGAAIAPGTLQASLPDGVVSLSVPRSSGTETVYCSSDWVGSVGEAEAICYRELDRDSAAAQRRLEAQGRDVIGHATYPLDCVDDGGSPVRYRCSGRIDVNWVTRDKQAVTLNKSAFDRSGFAAFAANEVQQPKTEITELDDELLRRFKAKFGTDYKSIALKSVAVLASDVAIGAKLSSLPVSIAEENYVARNETADPQTRKFRITVTTVESERYTFKRTLVRGSTSSATVGFNIYGISGSGSNGASRSLTIDNSTEKAFQETKAYEEQFEQTVRPRTAMFIKVRRGTSNDVYALNGSILFDGTVTVVSSKKDVYACGFMKTDRCSRWVDRYTDYQLSQFVPQADRKFDMAGQVTIGSSANTSTEISYAETPLSNVVLVGETPPAEKITDPERDYLKVPTPPTNLTWRRVGQSTQCGFWIFRRAC